MSPKKKAAAGAKKEEKIEVPRLASPMPTSAASVKEAEKEDHLAAKKRKAEDISDDEPASKEAKKEETNVEKSADAAMAADEPDAEKEEDSPADKRAAMKETIGFSPPDCTLNVVPTSGGRVLMALSDGGMQYLIAGARANVGIKSGRYLYEVKVIEALNPSEGPLQNRSRSPAPRQLVRLGFSTAASSLIVGEHEGGFCFDSEGQFWVDKKKTAVSQRFARDQVIGIMLNMDAKSLNAYTVSLFCDGVRVTPPQKLPESFHGKALFPHVSFRNVSLQMHFGPQPLKALPFKCRAFQGAAQADVAVSPSTVPKDGKYEVLFPVGFPDEGTFDWLDDFVEKNPKYVELSDRKIIEWAALSGLSKLQKDGAKHSNDKPEFNFGLPVMDDQSCRQIIQALSAAVPRHYIVMEVKENLTEADRRINLKRFNAPCFKKVAHIVMGEPDKDFKSKTHEIVLKAKQDKLEEEWKVKQADLERKRAFEKRQKELTEMRRKAEEVRKKAEEERKRKHLEEVKKLQEEAAKIKEEAAKVKAEEEAKKKKAAADSKKGEGGENEGDVAGEKDGEDAAMGDAKEDTSEVKDEDEVKEEVKEEEVKAEGTEEVKDEDEKMEVKEESEAEEEMPEAELTEEEKKQFFRTHAVKDLTPQILSSAFGKFTIPEKDEGFDLIRFGWEDEEESRDYLKNWVLERKLTSRMDDLQPSQWFTTKHTKWLKQLVEWKQKQSTSKGKAKLVKAKKTKKEEGNSEDKKDEEKGEEKEDDEEEEEDEKEEEAPDIFAVENICDVGDGVPLFHKFEFEDWAMASLRYELFMLVHAFQHDVDDDERPGVHESHLVYYYNKYYRKQLTPKYYGKDTVEEVLEMAKDTVAIQDKVLKSELDGDVDVMDIFVKLTEENRRERQRRIDAGDETARVKFSPMLNQVAAQPSSAAGARPTLVPTAAPGARPYPTAWPAQDAESQRKGGFGTGGMQKGKGKDEGGGQKGKGKAWQGQKVPWQGQQYQTNKGGGWR